MSILSNATINSITESTFVVNTKDNSAFEKLKDAATPSAFHKFVGRPQPARCYPNTRVDVLGGLERWAMRLEPEGDRPDSSPAAGDHGHVDLSMVASVDENSDFCGTQSGNYSLDLYGAATDNLTWCSVGSAIGGEISEPPTTANSDDGSPSFEPATARIDGYPWRRKRLELPDLPIIWLNGGAGAGKSAVAQTFAERCEDLGHIVASFFFFSTDPTRNSANHLAATLVYQIARAEPGARTHMEAVIRHDPHIFNHDFKTQFTSLIIDPIQRPSKAQEPRRPCTIIIDGLDECTGGVAQAGIVRAISDVLRGGIPNMDISLPRFLICSRPEEPITQAFRSPSLQGVFTAIDLSNVSNASHDIYTFLDGKFNDIKKTHSRADLIPESWPSLENLYQLKSNSSGHFIYAATVMKFISTDVRPVNALDIILGLRASPQSAREAFAELDVLYHHILSRAVDKSSIDNIRHVFGLLALENSPACYCHPDTLEKFLNLQDGELDVLFGITASLVAVKRSGRNAGVSLHHKTFSDFLHDKTRAGRFYIEEDAVCAYACARCYDMIQNGGNLDNNIYTLMTRSMLDCSKDYDFVAGQKSHSLRGMAQRREATAFIKDHDGTWIMSTKTWAYMCFSYFWSLLNILRKSEESDKLIYRATGDMISITKDLIPQGHRLWIPDLYPDLADVIGQFLVSHGPVGYFLSDVYGFTLSRNSRVALARTFFEDKRMGEHCLDEEHYAEACLFLVTRLSNADNFFTSQSLKVIQNQRLLMMNGAARRQQTPFRWRKITRIIRPFRTNGRACFLQNHQDCYMHKAGVISTISLTRRELNFGSRPNMVLQKRRDSTISEAERSHWPFHWGARNSIAYSGKRTTVRGYIMVSESAGHLASSLLFLPFREIKAISFKKDFFAQLAERERRQLYAAILSGLPAMFAKASKSDAVAALRFKTFAPLARRFPERVRRARLAMEEYAIKYGYPAIDGCFGNPLEIASVRDVDEDIDTPPPVAGLVVSTAAPLGEAIIAHPPPSMSISTCGQKRSRLARSPLNHANHPSTDICDEPGCETKISDRDRSINCSSPDCNRKYHFRCQGLTDIPATEWFCDDECERDVAVRKRMRYKL